MRARLERWLSSRWYGTPGLLLLLLPLEWIVRGVAIFRARRVRRDPPLPLIVVGNIAVGGSGKTPLVILLTKAFIERGFRVGIVSRGYGGAGPFPMRVVPDGDVRHCGDEPVLIARETGVPVVVGPDRMAALTMLLAASPVDVVISDDGLQHVAMPRTVEIVVVDGRRGHGNGHCLPVGPLREPLSRLGQVDFVVANGGGLPGCVAMQLKPIRFRQVNAPGNLLSFEAFSGRYGQRVSAIAGIGNPGRFFESLRATGFVPDEHPFPDHHDFRPVDFSALPRPLVMTAKDAVKCAGWVDADTWYLEVEARLPDDFLAAVLARTGLSRRR